MCLPQSSFNVTQITIQPIHSNHHHHHPHHHHGRYIWLAKSWKSKLKLEAKKSQEYLHCPREMLDRRLIHHWVCCCSHPMTWIGCSLTCDPEKNSGEWTLEISPVQFKLSAYWLAEHLSFSGFAVLYYLLVTTRLPDKWSTERTEVYVLWSVHQKTLSV